MNTTTNTTTTPTIWFGELRARPDAEQFLPELDACGARDAYVSIDGTRTMVFGWDKDGYRDFAIRGRYAAQMIRRDRTRKVAHVG